MFRTGRVHKTRNSLVPLRMIQDNFAKNVNVISWFRYKLQVHAQSAHPKHSMKMLNVHAVISALTAPVTERVTPAIMSLWQR